ncbi:hypothetical protein GN956_G9751 [Arapaima gigas]
MLYEVREEIQGWLSRKIPCELVNLGRILRAQIFSAPLPIVLKTHTQTVFPLLSCLLGVMCMKRETRRQEGGDGFPAPNVSVSH